MNHVTINLATGETTERPYTAEELAEVETEAWRNLRTERDSRLAASDWTVLSDSPTSTTAWKAYRQELRDLPANTTDPTAVVWPTPPS